MVSYLVYFSPLMASESRFLCTLITKLQDWSPWMFLNSNQNDYLYLLIDLMDNLGHERIIVWYT